jgi:predicted DNA-binding transcriptional regulator
MNFVIDQLTLLGLNGREVRVFTTLTTFGRMNMTLLAARAGLPRTTVDAVVRRLIRQGLIFSTPVNKHTEYYVELETVTQTLDSLSEKMQPTKKSDENIGTSTVDMSTESLSHACKQFAGNRTILIGRSEITAHDIQKYIQLATDHNCLLTVFAPKHPLEQLMYKKTREQGMRGLLFCVPALHCTQHIDIFTCHTNALFINPHTNTFEATDSKRTIEAVFAYARVLQETGWCIYTST